MSAYTENLLQFGAKEYNDYASADAAMAKAAQAQH